MALSYIKKDLTRVAMGIVAHGVNCQHAMNSGLAKAIRQRWPKVYEQYMRQPRGKTMLGTADVVFLDYPDVIIINCYTQLFYGFGGKFASPDAIRTSLHHAARVTELYDIPLYLPRIGCGLGGLDWDKDVCPIVEGLAEAHETIDIVICDPP